MNPYTGNDFFQFFLTFFKRIGRVPLADLASDEVQIYVLCLVAISCALVGALLVLKKMTMLANSLSHTILLGIVITYLILIPFNPGAPFEAMNLKVLLIASLVTGIVTTLLTQLLTHLLKLQEDASTGLVFTTLFALGIVLVTVFTRNAHLGVEAIMGNVDALHVNDLTMVFWVALVDVAFITLFYKELKMVTFDSHFATTQGFSTSILNYLLMILTAATVIGAFRSVGVLLVLSFLVTPALMARLLTHRLKYVLLFSAGIGIFISFVSVALSRHFLSVQNLPLSTGGLAVTLLGGFYLVLLACRKRLTGQNVG